MKKVTLLKFAAAGVLAVVALPTMASNTWNATWNWAAPCNPSNCIVNGPGTSVMATISAYSTLNLNSTFSNATFTADNNSLGIRAEGTETTAAPHDSIDNIVESGNATFLRAEVLAIEFNKGVDLNNVAVSWTYDDSDAMIFAWTGDNPPPSMTSITGSSLPVSQGSTSAGWKLVKSGQFGPDNTNCNNCSLNIDGTLFSSHWLVSTALYGSNDGFKVSSFTGDVCQYAVQNGACTNGVNTGGAVPEPGSLALAGIALLGFVASRRRNGRPGA